MAEDLPVTRCRTVLLTGGSGFLGDILKKALLQRGFRVVSVDLDKDETTSPGLISFQGDIRDVDLLDKVGENYRFDAIFHVAAVLALAVRDSDDLWTTNTGGTRNIAEFAKKHGVPKIIFTSTNALWGDGSDRPVREDDEPNPVEIYGRSKLVAEKILLEEQYQDHFKAVVFRCPTIIDSGRLGLLTILFEFIDEGRKVWVVGGGKNRYQFVYAMDLVEALVAAVDYDKTDVFHIGSDNVPTFREAYNYVIGKAGTTARVASLPRGLVIPAMKAAYALNLSPLGPYQYSMIAKSCVFDTSKIKTALQWAPTLTNEEMLYQAYRYYHENLGDIRHRTDGSAHRQAARMGVIKLLKWVS